MYVFRLFFRGLWLVELLASGNGSGTPLIQLGVFGLSEYCHTQVYEDDLKNEDNLKNEDHLKNEDNLWWKTTFHGGQPLMEDDLFMEDDQ